MNDVEKIVEEQMQAEDDTTAVQLKGYQLRRDTGCLSVQFCDAGKH